MTASPTTVRVAAIQTLCPLLDLERGLGVIEEWTRRAAREGARVVVLPETFLPGYPAWLDVSAGAALWDAPGPRAIHERLMSQAVEVPGPACERLARCARAEGVTLVVGVHERAGRTLYNTILTFSPDGALRNHHRKLVPTYSERMVWGAGDAAGLLAPECDGVRVGALVCWEHWMPTARQAMHDAGEDLHAALWPAVREMHLIASRHYAFEGRCFVVAAGSLMRAADLPRELPPDPSLGLSPDAWVLDGGSAVIAPDGRLLAGPVRGEEALVLADCDLGEIARGALTLDVSGHYSRPDVFTLQVDRSRRGPITRG